MALIYQKAHDEQISSDEAASQLVANALEVYIESEKGKKLNKDFMEALDDIEAKKQLDKEETDELGDI